MQARQTATAQAISTGMPYYRGRAYHADKAAAYLDRTATPAAIVEAQRLLAGGTARRKAARPQQPHTRRKRQPVITWNISPAVVQGMKRWPEWAGWSSDRIRAALLEEVKGYTRHAELCADVSNPLLWPSENAYKAAICKEAIEEAARIANSPDKVWKRIKAICPEAAKCHGGSVKARKGGSAAKATAARKAQAAKAREDKQTAKQRRARFEAEKNAREAEAMLRRQERAARALERGEVERYN